MTRFAPGQTFITPGAEEALQIAGQTAILNFSLNRFFFQQLRP
jgi:hypothetical protein